MAVSPNPTTTEWVPLWDLNGGISTIAPHHLTHETGGSDPIVSLSGSVITSGTIVDARLSPNVVLQDKDNTFTGINEFTKSITINYTSPGIFLIESDQGANLKNWKIGANSQIFSIFALDDSFANINTGLEVLRNGSVNISGGLTVGASLTVTGTIVAGTINATSLGTTPLNASNLISGTVPDARLSINVLKFTGGYPGGTSTFLRADGTFSPPPAVSAHHTTHETGGTDAITSLSGAVITSGTIVDARLSANVAMRNASNTFTGPQILSYAQPEVRLFATDQPVDARVWRIIDTGNFLYFQSTNDAVSAQQGAVTIDRTGVLSAAAGLGSTPLNASQLTSGIVPSARLSPDSVATYGSWVPVIGGSGGESGQAYSSQVGHWCKIGRLVHVWSYTQFSNKGTITGNLMWKGLPFVTGFLGGFFSGFVAYLSNKSPNMDYIGSVYVWIGGSQSSWNIYGNQPAENPGIAASNPRPLNEADINNLTQFIIHASYLTD